MKHQADCAWEKTTPQECQYRDVSHYCPHPEHACDCEGVKPQPNLLERAQLLIKRQTKIHSVGCDCPLCRWLAEYEVNEKTAS